MPATPPASELVALPPVGRRFAGTAEVRLGDTDPSGRLRLDALARYLQDVANDDARDAILPNAAGWVVRRTMVHVVQPAHLAEQLALITFCAGTGRSWAERRTTITGSDGASAEAVSLWVQVDPASGRPLPLDEAFHDRYGAAAGGRRVSARLTLPGPTQEAQTRPWPVRAADLDVFGHANNAVQLAILEEVLEQSGGASVDRDDEPGGDADRRGVAEIEYLAPLDLVTAELRWDTSSPPAPGTGSTAWSPPEVPTASPPAVTVSAWLVVDGDVRTAARWTPS